MFRIPPFHVRNSTHALSVLDNVFQVLVMAGLNASGLQSKLLITHLVSEAIIIIIILCSLKSRYTCTLGLATVVITLGNLASFPSYSCLVYNYDTMIMQFYY